MIKRKWNWRRSLSAALAVVCLFSVPTEVKADIYWPEGPAIESQTAIVYEINSGAVLYEKNSNQINYPASITKIMTTMLALEYCELDEVVSFSDDAIKYNQGNTSHIARDYGEKMTMEQCLYAVMLESANECAYAVAEHVAAKLGGDYQSFVDLMNERAKELGCTNTHFTNANGLPDKEHVTTAYDMALISAEAYKNETFQIIIGTRSYRIPPTNKHDEITPLNNHHGMISDYKTSQYLYKPCTGGKTGHTDASGNTLVTYAEKDDLTLVSVIMKSDATGQYTDTISLFEYCFQNFQSVSIADTDVEESEKDKGIMDNHEAFVKMDENARVIIPITADVSDLEVSLVTKDLPSGIVAKLKYTYGGHQAGSVNVVLSNEEVEEDYFSNPNENEDVNIIEIKPSYILMAVVIIAAIGAIIYLGKRLYDNFYVILHDLEVKKQRKRRFRPISKKRKKWKKKDRMFK